MRTSCLVWWLQNWWLWLNESDKSMYVFLCESTHYSLQCLNHHYLSPATRGDSKTWHQSMKGLFGRCCCTTTGRLQCKRSSRKLTWSSFLDLIRDGAVEIGMAIRRVIRRLGITKDLAILKLLIILILVEAVDEDVDLGEGGSWMTGDGCLKIWVMREWERSPLTCISWISKRM